MMNRLKSLLLVFLLLFGAGTMQAVDVTFTTDDDTPRTAAIERAERNLAQLLTEINRAQQAGSEVSVRGMAMNEFSKESLVSIWAVTPFYCDDEEVVDRLWTFKNGTMMASHIPLIITPKGESFGSGTYQEAVVEFDRNGSITDFRFALDAQTAESMERCGSVASKEQRMIILQYVERFRTAYNQKDIATIERMFSDDALIITGNVVTVRQGTDQVNFRQKVQYTKQTKAQYIRNLRLAFLRNKWIDVKFSQIGENGETGGCDGITQSRKNKNMYGVRMRQQWKSSNYHDEGYLFLLWEFPEGGGDPIIHVRTWQPEYVGGQRQEPDAGITTLGGFDL